MTDRTERLVSLQDAIAILNQAVDEGVEAVNQYECEAAVKAIAIAARQDIEAKNLLIYFVRRNVETQSQAVVDAIGFIADLGLDEVLLQEWSDLLRIDRTETKQLNDAPKWNLACIAEKLTRYVDTNANAREAMLEVGKKGTANGLVLEAIIKAFGRLPGEDVEKDVLDMLVALSANQDRSVSLMAQEELCRNIDKNRDVLMIPGVQFPIDYALER